MRVQSFKLPLLFLSLARISYGMLVEEIGLNDFLVSTAGHFITNFVHSSPAGVITSDCRQESFLLLEGDPEPTSCLVASRSVGTGSSGSPNWRRNVCSHQSEGGSHVIAVLGDRFYTSDDRGVLRAWGMETGALLWDMNASKSSSMLRLWTFAVGSRKIVAASDGGVLTLRNAINGRNLKSIEATEAGLEGPGQPTWLHVMPHATKPATLLCLVGLVSNQEGNLIAAADQMLLWELKFTEEGLVVGEKVFLEQTKATVVASSLRVQKLNDEWHALAIGADGLSLVHFSLQSDSVSVVAGISQLHPLWTSIKEITPQSGDMLKVLGSDDRHPTTKDTMALYRFDGFGKWDQWYGASEEESTEFDAIIHCASADLVLGVKEGNLLVYGVDSSSLELAKPDAGWTRGDRHKYLSPLSPLLVAGDSIVVVDDLVSTFELASCSSRSAAVLLSTPTGTTRVITLSPSTSEKVIAAISWTTEEGLSTVSSALLLDASNSGSVPDALTREEEQAALSKLEFMPRLESQLEVASSLFQNLFAPENRDHEFGFVKTAVFLSQKAHRVWGMPTSGSERGLVTWTLNLPRNALWHTLVQGKSSPASIVHGINGATHSQEVLALSSLPDSVSWMCFDGITGRVISNGTKAIQSPVGQIVPLFGGDETSCRQAAVMLHDDHTATIIPDDDKGLALAQDLILSSRNGMFAHIVDRESSAFETFQFTMPDDDAALQLRQVGQTTFPGETIVRVVYPQRDEVMESPSSVLGDDSLLLKYINPHLAVVVTVSDNSEGGGATTELTTAISRNKTPGAGKRKPAGATQNKEATKTDASIDTQPNLFVSILDAVSGRVLYRVSHVGATLGDSVPCVITENWVMYAFFNAITRRTELGVLSLYEGMIDKSGLTAFSSPEQALSFSSLEARDSKPVVLSKTYAIVKPVTALGVTSTKGGISTRHLLVASGDDKLTSVAVTLLEPRRPMGELKDFEKQEGLFQYSPLVPLLSMSSPSYNQTVQGVSKIISSPTALESQSVILAFGGPDIFFARVSPSKGFDLLPESFNRVLLSIVVLGLVVVLGVSRYMSNKKVVKLGWV